MTETEYRKLLIDSVCAGEYPEKDALKFEKQMRLQVVNSCNLCISVAVSTVHCQHYLQSLKIWSEISLDNNGKRRTLVPHKRTA